MDESPRAPDYPTEWQLLWVQGLAQPNKTTTGQDENPEVFYSRVGFVASIVSKHGPPSTFEISRAIRAKLHSPSAPLTPCTTPLLLHRCTQSPKHWRELAGSGSSWRSPTRLAAAGPGAAEFGCAPTWGRISFYRVPTLSADIPADVSLTAGAPAPASSLAAAMDYLEAHPDKRSWVMNWDAPTSQ